MPAVGRSWRVTVIAATITVIAGCVAAALSALVPSRVAIPGLPDAGALTDLGLPAVKAVFDLTAALTIGWLIAAAALAPPQRSGVFDVGGYRAIRAASLSASVWAVSSLALIPLTLSNTVGRPLSESFGANAVLTGLSVLDSMRGYAIAAVVAALIAIIARFVLRPTWAFVLLAGALAALVPMALAGHSAQSGDHDLAVDTMLYHLLGVSIWVGGLLAFLGLARQRAAHLDVIARRYSTMALVAFIAVAASGIGNAWIRLPYLGDLWTTDYGRLILLKAILLVALGGFGYLHRRRTLPAIRDGGDARPLIRLAAVEIAVMAIAIGVASALARTATPPPTPNAPSNISLVLGFDLSGSPTFPRLMLDWRFDLLAGTGSVLAAALYLLGVRRLRRRGDDWPIGRTVSWLLGCFSVLMATSSGLGRYAIAQFSVHMMEHMLLGMLAPILLALGGAVTLLLRVLPAAGRDGVPGLREAVLALLHCRLTRFFTHPLIVLPLFVGSFYVLYFTPLFAQLMSSHLGHLLMTLHFLVVGYLFYWVIIGIDPTPRRFPHMAKLGLVLAAMPFHAFFGLAVMSSNTLMAPNYFRSLALPWVPNLISDQHLGGAIAWGAAEVPLLVVMVALAAQWARSDEREARRRDRFTQGRADPELDAYNAMLAKMDALDRGRRVAAIRIDGDGVDPDRQPSGSRADGRT